MTNDDIDEIVRELRASPYADTVKQAITQFYQDLRLIRSAE